ncbi:MAG TPA: FMN-binding negative transcriptional regulator [Ktedonobacterales bacterium]|nr:FMN-binding negative transcriptional regulator [Ktedonobacterales bacterium]
MYIPPAFREDDLAVLHALMRDYSFAILVTQQGGVPVATHLPLLLDARRGPYGTLLGHVSRANAQWTGFNGTQEALVIFQGPHAYITPSWYEPGLNVPTWNYAAVHAYGTPRIIEDQVTLVKLLDDLVQTYESGFEQPWKFDYPEDALQSKLKGIVGFEMEITRLEGKLKMSQNRSEGEQDRVAAELQASQDTLVAGVGGIMSKRRKS